ncbi:predicted protein [Naegleria gruberi]|uniref:Predicted protein n=1 Tax=Naegleria gruberi TaxID=5762 RepID=D2W214_NAEGR|nr:uncharacterized protein NAEGRDRAFT_75423 [Naegleria gruberi]EFC36860.1 predicted protein [Naegleria gruberi]|eukprot:XP_002669604.1 predicted protein [Naegleria gruberi strain NEG-M]
MENLGAELCYLAQLPPEEQFTIRLVIIWELDNNKFLVCRAKPDNAYPFLNEDMEYSNADIVYFSPIEVYTHTPVITGDVVEVGRILIIDNALHLDSVTFIEKANTMPGRIEYMTETMNDIWIQKEYVSNGKSSKVEEESEIDASLLDQLPFDMKFEIISFIPTYSKQERIKLVERNVRIACELLKICEDEFNDKYCDKTCTAMRIEKRLNPDRLYEIDNDFIRFVKMRLINKEFAKIMKENIMKLDLLYIYRDDIGRRRLVRTSIELARRDYFKDPSLNPIYFLYYYSQIEKHAYPYYGYNDLNIACAPSLDKLSRFDFAVSFYEKFGLSSNEIYLMEKIDFCVNRKELKLYRPTFILEEFRALLGEIFLALN